jgi:hypothetical protein
MIRILKKTNCIKNCTGIKLKIQMHSNGVDDLRNNFWNIIYFILFYFPLPLLTSRA